MVEDMLVWTSSFLTGFRTLLSVCCEWTDCESLFHSVGVEAIATPRLPMAFLGQIEKTDSRFPPARPLVLIKDDKYVSWDFNLLDLL